MAGKDWAYVRTSTTDQTLEQQRDAIQHFAGDDKEITWVEEQLSGWRGKRPEYEMLKSAIARGWVRNLYCFSVSRFGRNVQEGARLLILCQERNVRVQIVCENLDFSGVMGIPLFTLFTSVAQAQSDTKSQTIKTKFEWKRKHEGWKSHGSPTHCVATRLKDKADTVYQLADAGKSNAAIARALEITEHSVAKLLYLRPHCLLTRAEYARLVPGWHLLPVEQLPTLEQLGKLYRESLGVNGINGQVGATPEIAGARGSRRARKR